MRAAAGFTSGFASGLDIASQKRAADQAKADREQMRADREADRAMREEDRALAREDMALRREEASLMASSYGEGGGRAGGVRPGGSHEPYMTGDPKLSNLAPHQKAFLNAIAGGESGGAYDVRYTPEGGTRFDGFDAHPGIFEEGPEGPSSAAGRYQFVKTTWDDMGGGAFTPERQDMRAWKLANDRYRASTGRDLDSDLKARGLTEQIIAPLAPTWAAFRKEPNRHIATYNASLARYGAPAEPARPARGTAPAPAAEAPNDWGVLRRLQTAA